MDTKYRVNAASGVVPRHNVVKKMKTISTKKNIFITAPAGYGKTIAAEQFLVSVRGFSTKLAVTNDMNIPRVFYSKIALSLLKLVNITQNFPHLSDLKNFELTLEDFLVLLKKFPIKNARCYLLTDDFHLIKNKDVLNKLPMIIAQVPGYIRLCFVSRNAPINGLMNTGLFECLYQDDLIFSAEETEWLGAERDITLSPERVTELLQITGGWPVQLSSLINNNPSELAQYIKKRVWDMWDNTVKKELLRLCIPDELTPELCEKLTTKHNGYGILSEYSERNNAFLYQNGDFFRFYTVFRDFLRNNINLLDKKEIYRLNEVCAKWYYERGDFANGVKHYGYNLDFDGIYKCVEEYCRYNAKTAETAVSYRQNIMQILSDNKNSDLIAKNPHLLLACSAIEYRDGNGEKFLSYIDIIRKNLPEITIMYPEFIEAFLLFLGWDFSVPIREYIKWLENAIFMFIDKNAGIKARVNTITSYLPFFHRSFRDLSEYHELNPDDIRAASDTFSTMFGADYAGIEKLLISGIYYERGELVNALRYIAPNGLSFDGGIHPELVFSANMLLSQVLYAMGAIYDADDIMRQTERFISESAVYLKPNFDAAVVKREISEKNATSAINWLKVHDYDYSGTMNLKKKLSFDRICFHYTTMRAMNAIGEYTAAIGLGNRLYTLSVDFKRPLDQIECGILLADAFQMNGEKSRAIEQLKNSLSIAAQYGFKQMFINEGRGILTLLCTIRERKSLSVKLRQFTETLINEINGKLNFSRAEKEQGGSEPPRLTSMQKKMLIFLDKGMSYGEIAAQTGTVYGTVKGHVLLLYKKLGVHNAEDAVVKGKVLGLI
ncbi:MAG: LuxR C-terminal-related transcriptional regulator [Oscillospiraceae bacterium]|nr:LuxR C-terminal-related transcriptional regulator [Oscillospiraceae bacterium]